MATEEKETLKWSGGKKARTWLSSILTVVLVGYIMYYISQNLEHFKVINSLGMMEILGLFTVALVTTLVSSLRLLIVMRHFGLEQMDFGHWFRIFILARFLNRVVPQGGNLYRALKLKKEKGFSLKNYTLSFLGFTWIDLLVTFSLIAIVLYRFQPGLAISSVNLLFLSLMSVVILIILPIIFRYLSPFFLSPYFDRVKKLPEFNKKLWLSNGLLCMLTFGLSLLWFYLGFRSIGVDIPVGALAVFTAIIRMGLIISITPGNIGVLELAYGTLASAFGFNFSTGVLVAAVTRAVSFISVLLLGAVMGGLPLVAWIKKEKIKKEVL